MKSMPLAVSKPSWIFQIRSAWGYIESHAAPITILLGLLTVIFIGVGLSLSDRHQGKPTKLAVAQEGLAIASTPAAIPEANAGQAGGTTFFDGLHWLSSTLYEIVQVFFLNMESHTDPQGQNVWLSLGRITAVLLICLVSFAALGLIFKDSWFRMRLWFSKNIRVVCGLGRIGWPIARELLEKKQEVIVVEVNSENWYVQQADRLGAITLSGDARNPDSFLDVPLSRVSEMFFVTGNDEANVRAAKDLALRASKIKSKKPNAIDCYVHVTDLLLEAQLRYSPLISNLNNGAREDGSFPIETRFYVFNILHDTAQQLILEHLTEIRPGKCQLKCLSEKLLQPQNPVSPENYVLPSDEVALYVLFGFGDLGKSIVIHLAELAHFENLKRSRILVFCEKAAEEAEKFHARYPRISPKVFRNKFDEIEFNSDFDDWSKNDPGMDACCKSGNEHAVDHVTNLRFADFQGTAGSRPLIGKLGNLFSEAGVCPAVIFCFDEDEENFSQANRFLQTWKTAAEDRPFPPTFAWFPKSYALMDVTKTSGEIKPFGHCGDLVTLSRITTPESEELEFLIYDDYQERLLQDDSKVTVNEKLPSDLSTRRDQRRKKYAEADAPERHSNKMAADHGQIKAKINEAGDSCCSDLQQIKQLLGQIEHNRYVAERLLADWSFITPQKYFGSWKIDGRKAATQRPHVCSWESFIKLRNDFNSFEFVSIGVSTEEIDEKLVAARKDFVKDPDKDFHQVEVVIRFLKSSKSKSNTP